jgi:hypothetical protein
MKHNPLPGQRYLYHPLNFPHLFIAEILHLNSRHPTIKVIQTLSPQALRIGVEQLCNIMQYPQWWILLPNQNKCSK